jgi:hypothetical protein
MTGPLLGGTKLLGSGEMNRRGVRLRLFYARARVRGSRRALGFTDGAGTNRVDGRGSSTNCFSTVRSTTLESPLDGGHPARRDQAVSYPIFPCDTVQESLIDAYCSKSYVANDGSACRANGSLPGRESRATSDEDPHSHVKGMS